MILIDMSPATGSGQWVPGPRTDQTLSRREIFLETDKNVDITQKNVANVHFSRIFPDVQTWQSKFFDGNPDCSQ